MTIDGMVDRHNGKGDAAKILGTMFGTEKKISLGKPGYFPIFIFVNIPQQYPQVFHNICGKIVCLPCSI